MDELVPALPYPSVSAGTDPRRPAVRAAFYLRVSTKDQQVENQRLDLVGHARARGWEVVSEYADVGISGAKAKRPGLDKLMDDARKRRFDILVVWRFDRFARSVKHLVHALHEFRALGIHFVSFQENVDTTSALGEAMFAIIAAISQLERDLIRERILAGLRRARAEGIRLGRPAKEINLERIRELRAEDRSIREIAQILGLSKSRVANALQGIAPRTPEAPSGPGGVSS